MAQSAVIKNSWTELDNKLRYGLGGMIVISSSSILGFNFENKTSNKSQKYKSEITI